MVWKQQNISASITNNYYYGFTRHIFNQKMSEFLPQYSITSLVRGFWDEKFSTRKSSTTEGNDKSPLTYQ